jgi:type III restriction enzyme
MIVDLFEFQQKALDELRERQKKAQRRYIQDKDKHIIPFTAPTGAGKTIIMSAFIEALYCGDTHQGAQNDAIVLWISDSPELNEQSKMKLYAKADKLMMRPVVTIDEKSFKADKLQLGTIYFVNTQKFGANSNLVKYSNDRNYTGWDFMRNTIDEYGEKLIVIIDEAHRGAKTDLSEQMSIMQKFILGSTADNMPSMPLVIGMSATLERFNTLANTSDSTQMPKVEVTADEVRESGLLKDKINIHHPKDGETFAEMTYLAQAAKEWRDKCNHWEAYKAHENIDVCPALVVQVKNGKNGQVSETNLDECIRQIESSTGIVLNASEVVHTFNNGESVVMNGLDVKYLDPSRIAEKKGVKVIFFKDNLTTGWDCPRAETMMSFKVATGYTNIAQLLGRMVRTPLQKRIETDDTLNEVNLYLPNFNSTTVERVKRELEGAIPTEVETHPTEKQILELRGILPCGLSREDIHKAINDAQIDTYAVPKKGITNYRTALFKLCHLLVRLRLCRTATKELLAEIVGRITSYIQQLEKSGEYEKVMERVHTGIDNVVSLDALGSTITEETEGSKFGLTDTDIYNWSENVEAQFGRDGILTAYRRARENEYDNTDLRLHFILYVYDQTCREQLDSFCKTKFHEYVDTYRHDIEARGETEKREFEKIVKAHVSTQPFDLCLPDLIVTSKNPEGQVYTDHLYCDNHGEAIFKLDTWEIDVLEAERQKEGFVCWFRNIPNKESSLCIQYKADNELKPHFPDFIIVRKVNEHLEFYLLEPHYTGYADSVPKLKGMAYYSERCTSIKRNEMLRVVNMPTGKTIQALNAASSLVRNDIFLMNDHDELNNLFVKVNHV